MPTIALLGNPNTGKTTLFNELTDTYAYVGNWTGVTVDKKIGQLHDSPAKMVDLPGIYSLNPLTKDEAVATDYLLTANPNLILNVTNASQLKRNLLLTIELLESGTPVVLVLNMIDDLYQTPYLLDLPTLAQRLSCQVKTTNARNKQGVAALHQRLLTSLDQPTSSTFQLTYPAAVEQALATAVTHLTPRYSATFSRWLAIQFMAQNQTIRDYAQQHHLQALTTAAADYDRQNFERQIFQTRQAFITTTLQAAQRLNPDVRANHLTQRIDEWVTHPLLGLPIFVGIFWLMFKLSFDWIGTPASNLLNTWLSGPITDWANHLLSTLGTLPFLQALLVDGILNGVGGVLTFVPQIFVLFACISILEDSGYMARAALVTDRLMQVFGLNGKSFIPLIIGFGCNVTGVMATRTIEQPKERLITILLSPFMSCSARLPIYSLFVAAFFSRHQAVIVLSLYFLGIVVALAMAKGYQLAFHLKATSDFIIELPQYHLPRVDLILRGTWDKGKGFVKKAGTVIFAGTVLVWLLSNLSWHGMTTDIDQSLAANLGQLLLPLFIPLGVRSWQVVSALITGVMAKEIITASMIVLFHLSGQTALVATFSGLFTPLSAYSLLVFILLYIPCFSTLATIKAETGSTKWMLYSGISSFLVAYALATIIFQVGSLFV
ncbi:ferrous iron transport protein B [Levilactobacillus namurensis]|uniref:Ferrous iron transport protein B n=1 Tax=Levilactobacillus namurensis TaxID=380393 RepID=A0AAW8W924_9LACO|nr:ferrous iron transport protein B [Levilactobacillus namurensis]MDT7015234.1 ferrous iron transport protein B [Levilactobacillus namurensis]